MRSFVHDPDLRASPSRCADDVAMALLLAVAADRVIRAATAYRTALIWPYAVAPALLRASSGIS